MSRALGHSIERQATPTVLFIDQHKGLSRRYAGTLIAQGYDTQMANGVAGGLRQAVEIRPDIIVASVGRPSPRDISFVSGLRENDATAAIPLIVVSDSDERHWQRRFMEHGADDYISQPVMNDELLAAIRARIRRWNNRVAGEHKVDEDEVLTFAGWRFEVAARRLTSPQGDEIGLTMLEARLLAILARKVNQAVGRYCLIEEMGRVASSPFDRTVDVLISRLRCKVEEDRKNPRIIQTIRSVGYVLRD